MVDSRLLQVKRLVPISLRLIPSRSVKAVQPCRRGFITSVLRFSPALQVRTGQPVHVSAHMHDHATPGARDGQYGQRGQQRGRGGRGRGRGRHGGGGHESGGGRGRGGGGGGRGGGDGGRGGGGRATWGNPAWRKAELERRAAAKPPDITASEVAQIIEEFKSSGEAERVLPQINSTASFRVFEEAAEAQGLYWCVCP